MIRTNASIPLALLAALLLGSTTPASAQSSAAGGPGASIDYTVAVADPTDETFKVSATLRGITDDTLVFHFPVWAPGAYDIVNFGTYVSDFQARSVDGRALAVARGDSNTFLIAGAGPETRLSYVVDDIEHVPNSAWFSLSDVEPGWVFAVGAALFGYPSEHKEIPYSVTYEAPDGWPVAVALDRASGSERTYVAASYDELVDAPVQMGPYQTLGFELEGIPHVINVTAPEKLDDTTSEDLVDVTRRIVIAMSDLFGEMPYKRYLFQHYLVNIREGGARGGFGALEHANSSTYRMPWWGQESVAPSLASVIAHEYWHLWSPKRIHVHELGPFDYQRGPETASLWFAEGLTEYYARAITARLGISTPQAFLNEFLRDMAGLHRRAQHEPMTSLSRRIVHAPTSELIDLYKKGPLLGFLLDTEIRAQTKNAKSLDDAMRYFNEEYGKKGRTFGDEEIIPIMERATGATLGDFYARYIAGTDTLPFDLAFRRVGLAYIVRDTLRPGLGAALEPARGGVRIAQVFDSSSASVMGLRQGDLLSSLDYSGYSIPLSAIPMEIVDRLFAESNEDGDGGVSLQVPGGSPADGATRYAIRTVTVTRDGKPVKIPATVRMSPATIERLDLDPSASAEAVAMRRSMVGF